MSPLLLRPDLLPPRVHFTCSTLSPGCWNSGLLKAGKVGIHLSLFCVLHHSQASCLIQQQAQIVLSLPCVSYHVFFDIPEQIWFCLDFSFPNFHPGGSDNVPVFLPDCVSLLPHSIFFSTTMILLCVWPGATCSFMRAKLLFINFCPSSYSLGWINSWTWKNINKLSWFLQLSPPSRTWSHGTSPSKSLKWLNSALLNSRVVSFLSDRCFLLMMLNSNISLLLWSSLPSILTPKTSSSLFMRYSKAPLPSKSYLQREKLLSGHPGLFVLMFLSKYEKKNVSYITHLWILFIFLVFTTRYILIVFIYAQKNIFPYIVTQHCSSPIFLPSEYISLY